MKRINFVGLDVHVETIAVAVAEQDGEVRTLGVIPNREESIRKLVKKLGPVEQLRFCNEGGVRRVLAADGPGSAVRGGGANAGTGEIGRTGEDRDRGDALKLARNYRGGELTAVWVPDAAQKDQLRAKHRLSKFLLRHVLWEGTAAL